jgi:hypothetical protein
LSRLGRCADAAAYDAALALVQNEAERRFLEKKKAAVANHGGLKGLRRRAINRRRRRGACLR